jgi:hypothetical protein
LADPDLSPSDRDLFERMASFAAQFGPLRIDDFVAALEACLEAKGIKASLQAEFDNYGQLLLYTGLCVSDDGELTHWEPPADDWKPEPDDGWKPGDPEPDDD